MLKRSLICAAVLTLASLGMGAARLSRTGLELVVRSEEGAILGAWDHASLNTSRIDALLARSFQPLRAEWTGYWNVPEPGFVRLVLRTDGDAQLEVDGVSSLGGPVAAGLHHLRVTYRPAAVERHEMFLKGVTADEASVAAERRALFKVPPTRIDRLVDSAAPALAVLALMAWLILLVAWWRITPPEAERWRRVPTVLLCGIVVLAALLRFEALVVRYAGAQAPDWADALAAQITELRPGAFEHRPAEHPYAGDPFSYLGIARSLDSFYAPSAREPLFPALTGMALQMVGDRDIGINILSALFSTLVCVAVYFLGSRLLSPWTGLVAAFLWAVEWQVISFSTEGWRDDLFALEVAACTAGLLALYRQPDRRTSIILGLCGGLTLLTRLSALTFLIPGLAFAVALPGPTGRTVRGRASLGALLWMLLLAGPFMAACAIGFGDPFYAVNVHAGFYQARGELPGATGSSALSLLAGLALPWRFVDTGFIGLTSYPFANKWAGLDALLPGLGPLSAWLALVGMPIVLWRTGGLLALLVSAFAILPYAWTWPIPGGAEWRFTLPAYPFYLVCTAIAAETAFRWMSSLRAPSRRLPVLRDAARVAATFALASVLFVWIGRDLNWRRVKEAVNNERSALIETGLRDRVFFASGWTDPEAGGGARSISIKGSEAMLRLPVTRDGPTHIVLRVGASAGPIAPVGVWLGDSRVVLLSGEIDSGRTETFPVDPQGPLQDEIELRFERSTPSPLADAPLSLLWVRVGPAAESSFAP